MSAMPHNTEVWIDDQPDAFIINVDKELPVERLTQVLEAAFNIAVDHWHRTPNVVERPHLRLHTG
ncbi:hypothetical protein [Streptomyces asiaticus]|uniref:hypothetical protein n=1 Tax=Streptomyces asiaticus TaxID=114695 RepID=UPI001BAE21D1|nr:hypothetical protein [Streptomyces asiaticus]